MRLDSILKRTITGSDVRLSSRSLIGCPAGSDGAELHYPTSGKRSRFPLKLERMVHIQFWQLWQALNDQAITSLSAGKPTTAPTRAQFEHRE